MIMILYKNYRIACTIESIHNLNWDFMQLYNNSATGSVSLTGQPTSTT